MRRHLIVTVLVLAVIGALVWSLRGEPDPPTSATAPHLLERYVLPDEALPPPHRPTAATGDAAPVYIEAMKLAAALRDGAATDASDADDADPARRLTAMLIDAMDRPHVADGFADAMIPMQPMARMDNGDAPQQLARAVLQRAQRRAESDEACGQCEAAILAVWTFGKRLFDHNLRLAARRAGLDVMQAASVAYLRAFGDAGSRSIDMRAWIEATQKLRSAWQIKLQGLYALKGSIGDLIRMADHDKDPTFRVAALLQLGAMRWLGHRSRANLAAIEACLERHAGASEAPVAAAVEAARAFTREQAASIR